jgi:murein DD-endopeptidase MepM/ murein hydrolase activator NlpD
MVESLRDRAWAQISAFVYGTFPERQVYIRSDGRVQFFTFSPMMQAVLAGISLIFLTWVAFTSVNTIFKDRIIAAKEQNFQQMQTSYETRIANLQLSYDELNGAVVATEDHFRTVVDDIESRHRMLADLIRSKENLREELGLDAAPSLVPADTSVGDEIDITAIPEFLRGGTLAVPVPGSIETPAEPSVENSGDAGSAVPAIRQLEVGPPTQGFLEGAVRRLGRLFGRTNPERQVDNPSLRQIAELEARLDRLHPIQLDLMTELQSEIVRDSGRFSETLRIAGIRSNTLLSRVNEDLPGIGGPQLPLPGEALALSDPAFEGMALETSTAFDEYSELATALRAVPLGQPLYGDDFWQASGFGARHDPFTKQLAFHGGIDFPGPRGLDVHVTAPGKVVFTGPRGAYGNAVEVDHGYGLKTRYGHLSKILVTVGAELEKGAVVGELGSTGRTTGPHLHYEVWFDDTLRNPSKFLRAGHYVYEEQGQ